MPDEPEENSLDGGLTNAGKRSHSPDDQSLGGGATYAGGQKSSLSDLSLGGGRTLGDRPREQETVIDDIEVVDLAARYKVEGTLGRGGMGEVLLALDTRLDRKVAIKRILGEAARSRTAVERFLTEAKSVAAINHPNVVQIYDYGRAKDGPFLIMEYVDGSSLLDRCRDGALPEEDAIDLACQLCDGLGKAHDLGIIHRDIKPANVLLTKDGVPKLTDFGLAKAETSDQQMTMTGAVLGTPDFMPPEQRRDAAEVDARSDLWSLAATLYQMVTGRSPKIIRFDLLPASLTSVLGTALEESKGDRFQTAKEFRDALKASQTAAEPAAADLGEGQCPACGVKNESARKFCRGCGESLEVPCLSCEKPMPMWEEICGQCGSKQTPLVEQRRGELSARQAEAESLLKDHRFEESEAIATELRDEADPRLKQLVPWATDFLPQIAAARDAALNRAAQLMQDALKHEASHDYPAAVSTLALVPEALQQRALPGCSEFVAQVIARVLRKSDQVKQLEELINERIRQKKVDGLLTEVDRLAALRPDRKDVRGLQEKLRDREKKKGRQRDVAVQQAKKFLVTREYDAAVTALRQVDRTAVTEEVTKLRAQAEDLQARLRSMLQTIQEARAAKHYDGLIDLVKEAIAFGPENAELTTLLVNLESREEKVAAEIADRIAHFDEALAQCDYQTAFETLNIIPEGRRNDEVRMRLERVERLGFARTQFYDAIARLPYDWKRQEAEEINLSRIANQGRSYLAAAAEYDIVDQSVSDWCEKLEATVEKQMAEAAAAEKTRENTRRALIAAGAVAAVLILIMIGLSIRAFQRGASIRSAIAAERWEDVLRLDSTNAEAYLGLAQDKLAASPPDIEGAFSDIDQAKNYGGTAAGLARIKGLAHAARAIEHARVDQIDEATTDLRAAESLSLQADKLTLVRGAIGAAWLARAIRHAESDLVDKAIAALSVAEGFGLQEQDVGEARDAIGAAWLKRVKNHAEADQFAEAMAELKVAGESVLHDQHVAALRDAIGAAWLALVTRYAEADQILKALAALKSAEELGLRESDTTKIRAVIADALRTRVNKYVDAGQIEKAVAEFKAAQEEGLGQQDLTAIHDAIGLAWRKRIGERAAEGQIDQAIADLAIAEDWGLQASDGMAARDAIGLAWGIRAIRCATADQIDEATAELKSAEAWGLQGNNVSAIRNAIANAWLARAKAAIKKKDSAQATAATLAAENFGSSVSAYSPLRAQAFVLEAVVRLRQGDEGKAMLLVHDAIDLNAEATGVALTREAVGNLRQRVIEGIKLDVDQAIAEERWSASLKLVGKVLAVDPTTREWGGKKVRETAHRMKTNELQQLQPAVFAEIPPDIIGSLRPHMIAMLSPAVITSLPPKLIASLPPLRNSIGMKLTLLPAGTFMMGDVKGDTDETPHEVTLTQPFYLGLTEVTNAQWQAVMGSVPSRWQDATRPVESVSWEDAVSFCKKLSAMPDERNAGRVYRLPTEAEWEYACRAGSTTAYSFGDDESLLGNFCWFDGNSDSQTQAVGVKQPNSWGLYDMHGNVWEWCSDWGAKYPRGAVMDPQGPASGSRRVNRGGSWGNTARECRSASRGGYDPSGRFHFLGFRLALSPSGAKPPEAVASERRPGGSMAEPAPTAAGASNAAQSRANEMPSTVTNSVDVELKLIPAGTFVMGDAKGDADTTPHEVTLTQPFYLGVTEVTNAQWQAVMGSVPSEWKDADRPVEQVSWDDVMKFCEKLSAMPRERSAGRVYRLPTEAEWEYACRAGSTAMYSFGDDESLLGEFGWFAGNANGQTQPVGQRQQNAWGLYDMHGNVWEWCSDWYGEYPGGSVTDPRGPSKGSGRVNRGGSWRYGAGSCRSALRTGDSPSRRSSDLGFRLALSPSGAKPPEAGTSERRPGGSMAEPATAAAGAENAAQPRTNGLPSTVTNSVDVELKLIPAGTFTMGDAKGDADETPHEVTLTQPFYLGVTEVTNAQWQAVMGSVPSNWQDADHPVEQVRWEDAVSFCEKLSAMPDERAAGREYRLPTEAEWEYACRAGASTRYSFGDDESLLGDFGWFESNSNSQTHPVGQRQANAWGLYDTHGNVWEWCSDWYGEYPGGTVTDPRGPSKGSDRVIRGGGWSLNAWDCRSASRARDPPSFRNNNLGFRLALSPSGARPPEAGR